MAKADSVRWLLKVRSQTESVGRW